MTEAVKTLAFLGAALVVGLVAYVSRPEGTDLTVSNIDQLINQPLFPEFKDPTAATTLEIVEVDESVGKANRFKVARDPKTGLWTIPSHNNYPADAENQMRDVSVLFIDLPILGIASTVSDDHELFGVKLPDEQSAETGKGLGLLVTMTDSKGSKLVELIVGKPVKNAENRRFVRKPGQDVVYDVAIDPSKLSTRFEDWIERDLLQLNAFDIESVKIQDYTVVGKVEDGALYPEQNKRMEATVKWTSSQGKWELADFVAFRDGAPVEGETPPSDELNTSRLNDLKTALDDLEIVDVYRKPKGLGANLRADKDILKDLESLQSLVDRGFYPIPNSAEGEIELRSANGEIEVGMKDGVEYILRFGNTYSGEDGTGQLSRFLFVTAQFDPSRLPMPEREEEAPEAAPASADSSSDDVPDAPSPDGAAQAPMPPADCGPDPAADAAAAEDTDTAAQEPAAQDTASQDAAPADGNDAAEPETPAVAAEPAAEGAATQPPAAADDEAAAAEREKREKEYQRKLDEREKKIEEGQKKVKELNDRFADWYYVISEDLYKKIHLERADLFRQASGDPAGETGLDEFQQLQQEGLEGGAANDEVPPQAPEASSP